MVWNSCGFWLRSDLVHGEEGLVSQPGLSVIEYTVTTWKTLYQTKKKKSQDIKFIKCRILTFLVMPGGVTAAPVSGASPDTGLASHFSDSAVQLELHISFHFARLLTKVLSAHGPRKGRCCCDETPWHKQAGKERITLPHHSPSSKGCQDRAGT